MAQSAGNVVWSCPSTFFGSKSKISRFGERFHDGQYSLVSFLFTVLLLTVQPFVKVGGTCPRALESTPLSVCTKSCLTTRSIHAVSGAVSRGTFHAWLTAHIFLS